MSYLVKTRTADQCRSHHQKMLKYHGNITQILERYRKIMNFGEEDRVTDENKKIEKKTGDEEEVMISSSQVFWIERIKN